MANYISKSAFALGVVIGAISPSTAFAIETPEERAQTYIDEARSTISTTTARLVSKSITCDSVEAFEGQLKIASVDGFMQGLVNTQPRFASYMQSNVMRAIRNLGLEAGTLILRKILFRLRKMPSVLSVNEWPLLAVDLADSRLTSC